MKHKIIYVADIINYVVDVDMGTKDCVTKTKISLADIPEIPVYTPLPEPPKEDE